MEIIKPFKKVIIWLIYFINDQINKLTFSYDAQQKLIKLCANIIFYFIFMKYTSDKKSNFNFIKLKFKDQVQFNPQHFELYWHCSIFISINLFVIFMFRIDFIDFLVDLSLQNILLGKWFLQTIWGLWFYISLKFVKFG